MSERKACGPHTKLAENDSVRVSQCGCGSVHVTVLRNGLTFRLPEEGLQGLTRGLMAALDTVEERLNVRIN